MSTPNVGLNFASGVSYTQKQQAAQPKKVTNPDVAAALADGRVSAEELIEGKRNGTADELIAFEQEARNYMNNLLPKFLIDFEQKLPLFRTDGTELTNEQIAAYREQWIESRDAAHRQEMLEERGLVNKQEAAQKKKEITDEILADGRVTGEELIYANQNNVNINPLLTFEVNVRNKMNQDLSMNLNNFENQVAVLALEENPDITNEELEQLRKEWLKATEDNYRQQALEEHKQQSAQ